MNNGAQSTDHAPTDDVGAAKQMLRDWAATQDVEPLAAVLAISSVTAKGVSSLVRDHPSLAMGIAMASGAVAGRYRLLSRTRDVIVIPVVRQLIFRGIRDWH